MFESTVGVGFVALAVVGFRRSLWGSGEAAEQGVDRGRTERMIDGKWLACLAVPAAWTIFFSLFNTPGIRGWRNLGWPSCYLVGLAMLWSIGWRAAGATWLSVGLATGLLYYLYEAWSAARDKDPAAKARLSTIAHGALAWPIMLPEVIEYSLADAGVLKASRPAEPTGPPSPMDDGG